MPQNTPFTIIKTSNTELQRIQDNVKQALLRLENTINAAYSGETPVTSFKVYPSAATVVLGANAIVTVVLDTVRKDTSGGYRPTTGEYIVKEGDAGDWLIGAYFRTAVNAMDAGDQSESYIYVNGAEAGYLGGVDGDDANGAKVWMLNGVIPVQLAVGDVVTFRGGCFNETAISSDGVAARTAFWGVRLGPVAA